MNLYIADYLGVGVYIFLGIVDEYLPVLLTLTCHLTLDAVVVAFEVIGVLLIVAANVAVSDVLLCFLFTNVIERNGFH